MDRQEQENKFLNTLSKFITPTIMSVLYWGEFTYFDVLAMTETKDADGYSYYLDSLAYINSELKESGVAYELSDVVKIDDNKEGATLIFRLNINKMFTYNNYDSPIFYTMLHFKTNIDYKEYSNIDKGKYMDLYYSKLNGQSLIRRVPCQNIVDYTRKLEYRLLLETIRG